MTEGRNDGRTDKANTKCPLAILWRGHKKALGPPAQRKPERKSNMQNMISKWHMVFILLHWERCDFRRLHRMIIFVRWWWFIESKTQSDCITLLSINGCGSFEGGNVVSFRIKITISPSQKLPNCDYGKRFFEFVFNEKSKKKNNKTAHVWYCFWFMGFCFVCFYRYLEAGDTHSLKS